MIMKDKKIVEKLIPQICSVKYDGSCGEGITNKLIGGTPNIRMLRLGLRDRRHKNVVVKKKSDMIILKGSMLLSRGDPFILTGLIMHHKIMGYRGSYIRESCIYENISDEFRKYMVPYFGSLKRPLRRECYLCMEKFSGGRLEGMKDYTGLIDIISGIAAYYYMNPDKTKNMMLNRYSKEDYSRGKRILRKLYDRLDNSVFGELECVLDVFISNLDTEFSKNRGVKTFSHNDLSDRNIVRDGNIRIYDWELACLQNPEHDLAEFLISVLHKISDDEITQLIDRFRSDFYGSIGKNISDEEFRDIMRYDLLEFAANKLTLLRTAALSMELGFTKDYEKNVCRLYRLLEKE